MTPSRKRNSESYDQPIFYLVFGVRKTKFVSKTGSVSFSNKERGENCGMGQVERAIVHIWTTHSFCSLSYDRSIASSKTSSPQSAI
jgi:hypothetical protein